MVCATCLQRVINNYEAPMKVWIHCLDNREMESELKGRIIRAKTQIKSFELYFGLHPGTWCYSHIDNVARSVQNKGMSACSSKRLANLTIQTLETLRNEERYENFCETVDDSKIAPVCESTNFEKKAKSTQLLHITIC